MNTSLNIKNQFIGTLSFGKTSVASWVKAACLTLGSLAMLSCSDAPETTSADELHAHTPTAVAANAEQAREVELTAAQMQRVLIKLGGLDSTAVQHLVKATGQLDTPPNQRVSVSSLIEGVIDTVAVLSGSAVRKGQLIVRLRHPSILELQENWVRATLALQQAEREFERQQELKKAQAGIGRKYQEAETALRTNRTELRLFAEKLRINGIPEPQAPDYRLQNTIDIRAAVWGYVSKLTAHRGQTVQPAETIAELIDPSHLHVHLQVYEQDLAALEAGQAFDFHVAGRTESFHGHIVLLEKDLNPETRTIDVHGHVVGNAKGLLPGMYVNAQITGKERPAQTVPETALVRYEGKTWVFVASQREYESGHFHFRMLPVEAVGASDGGRQPVRLLQALSGDERVVLSGSYELLSELRKGSQTGGGHGH